MDPLTVVASCLLSAVLFGFVRLRPSRAMTLATRLPLKPTVTQQAACLGQLPYAVVTPSASSLLLCHPYQDTTLTCPPATVYQNHRCEAVNPCYHEADGAFIRATEALHLPKNRRYHVCQNKAILDTRVCPDDIPYFNGSACVASDACSYLDEGTTFADTSSASAYFQCQNKQAVQKTCPPGHTFAVTRCMVDDMCATDQNRYHADPNDVYGYFKCQNKRAMKRKCDINHVFSPLKRQCVPLNVCFGKANTLLPVPTPFLKRSSSAIQCTTDDMTTRVHCPKDRQVYDEKQGACRDLDLCSDLKDGKIYPITASSYISCQNPITPLQVDITLKVDPYTGDVINRCKFVGDGTALGAHSILLRPQEYVVCQHERSLLHQCPLNHVFKDGRCSFEPCLLQPAAESSGRMDVTRFYYCQAGSTRTFIVNCPIGTVVSETHPPSCVPLDDPIPVQKPPRLTSQYSYVDSEGIAHSCRETPHVIANPWLFQCQHRLCASSLIHNYAFAPITRHQGAFCLEGQLERLIECQGDYFNVMKTFTGDFALPDCVKADPFKDDVKQILEEQSLSLYIHDDASHMIKEDHFTDKTALTKQVEPLYEGLTAIVGELPPSKEPMRYKCVGKASQTNIIGYPHSYYHCKRKRVESCPQNEVSLGWKCTDGVVTPVYGDCRMFVVGRSRIADDLATRRIFQCPEDRPIFNYLRLKCETSPPLSHLMCEGAYFRNFEVYAKPWDQFNLPKPPALSTLVSPQG